MPPDLPRYYCTKCNVLYPPGSICPKHHLKYLVEAKEAEPEPELKHKSSHKSRPHRRYVKEYTSDSEWSDPHYKSSHKSRSPRRYMREHSFDPERSEPHHKSSHKSRSPRRHVREHSFDPERSDPYHTSSHKSRPHRRYVREHSFDPEQSEHQHRSSHKSRSHRYTVEEQRSISPSGPYESDSSGYSDERSRRWKKGKSRKEPEKGDKGRTKDKRKEKTPTPSASPEQSEHTDDGKDASESLKSDHKPKPTREPGAKQDKKGKGRATSELDDQEVAESVEKLDLSQDKPNKASYLEKAKSAKMTHKPDPHLFPTLEKAAGIKSKEFIFQRCDKDHRNAWPQDFERYNPEKEGKPRQKWFPGTHCARCKEKHPTDAHNLFWEAYTRKLDRDSSDTDKATMCKKCLEKGMSKAAATHFTSDHGLMAPYDLPSNPDLETLGDRSLLPFRRPWPKAQQEWIPFHPYAFFPQALKDQKPLDYPNLHDPVQKLKSGLMLNDGNFHGQISAKLNGKPYRSQGKPVKVEKSATGSKKPSDKAESESIPIDDGSTGSEAELQTEESNPKPKLEVGWGGISHHKELPCPFWKMDKNNFPSNAFLEVIYPCLRPEEREYCERLQKRSEEYRIILQKFSQFREKPELSWDRREANSSAWTILKLYAQIWSPKWEPTVAFKKERDQAFKNSMILIMDPPAKRIGSIAKDAIEKALKEAKKEASKPDPLLSVQALKAHKDTAIKGEVPEWRKVSRKPKGQQVQTEPATEASSSKRAEAEVDVLKFETLFELSSKTNFELHKSPGLNTTIGTWSEEDAEEVATLPAKEYKHPQVDPLEESHYESHVDGWIVWTKECLSEDNQKIFDNQMVASFCHVLHPKVSKSGGPKAAAAVEEIHTQYSSAVITLITQLQKLAEEGTKKPCKKDDFYDFQKSIQITFSDYEASVAGAIKKLSQDKHIHDLLQDDLKIRYMVAEDLLGGILPGKSPVYTCLPRFAWSKSTMANIEFEVTTKLSDPEGSSAA